MLRYCTDRNIKAITEAAMNGEIDFKESLRRRVALLSGTSVDVLEKVKQTLTFTEGAHFLCSALKKLGFKLAVISGGFIPLARYVKSELNLDYAFANQVFCDPTLNYYIISYLLQRCIAQGVGRWKDFYW